MEITYHLKPTAGNPARNPEIRPQVPVELTPEPVPTQRKLDLAKGSEWARILLATREPDAMGKTLLQRFSQKQVAMMVGTSPATLSRLIDRFGKLETHELTCERLAPALDGGVDCEWEFLLEDARVRAKLLELYNATIGASSARAADDRRTAQAATALKQFAYEPECPAALGQRLRLGYQPVPFVKFLRSAVTPEGEARIRGAKHYRLHGPHSRRDQSVRLPNGDRFEWPAAWSMSADDMSVNHPFYVQLQDGSTILSRQGLYFMFAKHKVWQSVELVARPRESYTAADILRAFYKTCLAIGGVPQFVEFEQGIWKANKISGFTLDNDWIVEESVERPGMDTAQMNSITSGLGLCGVTVKYKTSAHQKHIETNFNYLQTIIAITARQYQCIGRYAGEFESSGKQLRRVRAESHHPRDVGFASQSEMADCIAEAMRRIGEMPSAMEGKTRAEAHWEDLQQVPLLPITPRLFAACLPGELRKTTIRNGYIHVEYRREEFQFRHEDFARLGDGYELYYKFDETDPNLGCAVFNRTSASNSANYQNWGPGDFMFCAPREIPGPKLEVTTAPAGVRVETIEERYGTGAVDTGDMTRRKQDKFNATQFRCMPRPGQIAVRSASARDGKGNVVEVTNQAVPGPNGAAAPGQVTGTDPAAALPPKPQARRSLLAAPVSPEAKASRRQRLAASAASARELLEQVENPY